MTPWEHMGRSFLKPPERAYIGSAARHPSAGREDLAESSPVTGSETLRDSLPSVPHKHGGCAKYITGKCTEIRAS